MARGAYQHKQVKKHDGERSHKAGNPRKQIGVNGFGPAMRQFFEDREQGQPSVSKILQTRGVDIGVTKWVSRAKRG